MNAKKLIAILSTPAGMACYQNDILPLIGKGEAVTQDTLARVAGVFGVKVRNAERAPGSGTPGKARQILSFPDGTWTLEQVAKLNNCSKMTVNLRLFGKGDKRDAIASRIESAGQQTAAKGRPSKMYRLRDAIAADVTPAVPVTIKPLTKGQAREQARQAARAAKASK